MQQVRQEIWTSLDMLTVASRNKTHNRINMSCGNYLAVNVFSLPQYDLLNFLTCQLCLKTERHVRTMSKNIK